MKNLRKILCAAIVLSLLTLVSCKKNTDDFVPYNSSDFNDTEWSNSNGAMSDARSSAMIAALSNTTTTATVSALSTNTVDLNNNTQIFLPANTYTLNGADYTGNVTISLNSVIKKGDFVRNLISNCNGNPLQETVAAFDLNLYTAAKEKLSFKPQNKFSLAYADTNFPGVGFNYYYGTLNQSSLNWSLADSLTGKLQIVNTTISGNSKLAYQISSNKLGLMTINKAVNLGTTTTCNVVLPINFTNKNTAVFAVFKNNNIILKLNSNATSKSFVSSNLPIGANVKFVALSYLDNQFYLGQVETLITNNAQYNIKTSATPISLSSLNSILDGL